MECCDDLCHRNEQNNELYQLKVDVGMLNIVKIYWADVSRALALRQSKREDMDEERVYVVWGKADL